MFQYSCFPTHPSISATRNVTMDTKLMLSLKGVKNTSRVTNDDFGVSGNNTYQEAFSLKTVFFFINLIQKHTQEDAC